ncbi:carboxylesterase/lipase family protein [Microbacterium sp. ASV49]|uniref:Carboxylic ester hydrolase n=1 Tax=Microbacterium candidum TaxID=3041922 RepID=A0ABT7MU58_9MICO|nr:carboxylesterase family protein [Microbacterium sp. ASV49]MDL9977968.1 carboxylesterase family protein [Microbacterium sp. ASV49]
MPYTTVTVDSGELRGIDNAGVRSFLGVPYGASTGGANRFRPPQPVESWDGVRDALVFGPSAPQADTRLTEGARGEKLLSLLYPRTGSPVEGSPMDEDCLRLNIWTPSTPSADGLPVLVWLHGGGFTHGSGNEMAFNGDVLAAAEDIVVVTVTHRLGILGFMDLREFDEAGSANAGMLDIVAALEWVQRNIAAFGGDPARVTISGQSGGSAKVATLGAMPAAEGLFARSIMMSGPIARANKADAAASLRADVCGMLGVTSSEELRAIPLERLIEAQAEVLRRMPLEPTGDDGRVSLEGIAGFAPSLDARDLPRDPFGDDAPAALADKALLIGWTTHEAGMFLANDPTFGPQMTAGDAAARVAAMPFGASYDELAAAHPDEPPFLLYARHFSAQMFQVGARTIADQAADRTADVWAYEFRQPTEVLGGILGACHSLELAYVFGTVDRVPLTGRSLDRLAVSRDMMRAWAAFARIGDPGWPRWSSGDRVVHPFGTTYGPDLSLPDDLDLAAA